VSGASKLPVRKGLGRGLGSLIPQGAEPPAPAVIEPTPAEAAAAADAETLRRAVIDVSVDLIDAMLNQPRIRFDDDGIRELSASIAESGIIQPLVVRTLPDGRYSLIAGERRLRASKLAGLTHVPVVVHEAADADAFLLALVENVQRRDLDPLEEADAYQRLVSAYGMTQEQVADRVGKSRPAVANTLRLLKLPAAILNLVAEGAISAGHARSILSVGEALHGLLAERIVTEGLSVRAAEELARALREGRDIGPPVGPEADPTKPPPRKKRTEAPELRPALRDVQRRLTQHLGTKVALEARADGSGTIVISFASDDVLQGVLDTLFI
jgi:ParB family chromosome partitioning protein